MLYAEIKKGESLHLDERDVFYRLWAGESRQVSCLLSKGLGLDDMAHDLVAPDLMDTLHEVDLVGAST